jgi:hypothetical protein
MITNISVLTPSAVHISVGQYNQHTQTLELWVYATRFKIECEHKFADIPEFNTNLCKDAKKVVIEDNDWGYRYEMTYNQFKKMQEDGFVVINLKSISVP